MTDALAPSVWRARRAAHERRVDAWTAGYRDRRRRSSGHPVEGFLFTYYSLRPAQLRRWHPGPATVLAGADPADLGPDYVATDGGATLDTTRLLARRGTSVAWIGTLLRRTAARPAPAGLLRHARVGDGVPAGSRAGAPRRLAAAARPRPDRGGGRADRGAFLR